MKFFDWVESVFYILPSLATFLTAWFVHKHTFPKVFTHQQHIFTFIPFHRFESNNEREVKSKLLQCKSNLCVRKAYKTEEKKYKICTNKFYKIRRLRKVNVYFLLETKTKQIGIKKNFLLLDVCTSMFLFVKRLACWWHSDEYAKSYVLKSKTQPYFLGKCRQCLAAVFLGFHHRKIRWASSTLNHSRNKL